MSRRLGVDLSSTHAVLASVRETRGGLQLRGFAVFEAEGEIDAIAADLRKARRRGRFPRAAEVVAWPGDSRVDAVGRAGCRVEHVITPGEALTRVVRLHQRDHPAPGVTAVVSLHLTSGTIALVRDGRLLFESQLSWSVAATLASAESELLCRYTFISELTESLRRVFELGRSRYAAHVTDILTCGTLPELRSLTMPLAAEFDTEVETLDSTNDIEIRVRRASPQQMRDVIASLRVAIAAGKRWHRRRAAGFVPKVPLPQLSRAMRVLAIAGACALAALVWLRLDKPVTPGRPLARSAASNPVPAGAPAQTGTSGRVRAVTSPVAAARSPVLTRAAPEPPALLSRGLRIRAGLTPVPRGLERPSLPGRTAPSVAVASSQERPRGPKAAMAFLPAPADMVVTSILWSSDRRLAVVNSRIVGTGDVVGAVTVVEVQTDAVLFRDRAGRLHRAPLR